MGGACGDEVDLNEDTGFVEDGLANGFSFFWVAAAGTVGLALENSDFRCF